MSHYIIYRGRFTTQLGRKEGKEREKGGKREKVRKTEEWEENEGKRERTLTCNPSGIPSYSWTREWKGEELREESKKGKSKEKKNLFSSPK